MTGGFDLVELIRAQGLTILAPLALIEGPIVSVLGGSLAGHGLLPLKALLAVLIGADLAGDALMYAVGRRGGRLLPDRLRARLPLSGPLADRLRLEIGARGGRLLLLGKLTHGAGFAVLLAAGAARYPFGRFLAVNLLGTGIKTGALVALGWWLGDQWDRAELWIDRAVLGGLALALLGFALWLTHHRRARA